MPFHTPPEGSHPDTRPPVPKIEKSGTQTMTRLPGRCSCQALIFGESMQRARVFLRSLKIHSLLLGRYRKPARNGANGLDCPVRLSTLVCLHHAFIVFVASMRLEHPILASSSNRRLSATVALDSFEKRVKIAICAAPSSCIARNLTM